MGAEINHKSIKQALRELIESLPEHADWDEVEDRVQLVRQIQECEAAGRLPEPCSDTIAAWVFEPAPFWENLGE